MDFSGTDHSRRCCITIQLYRFSVWVFQKSDRHDFMLAFQHKTHRRSACCLHLEDCCLQSNGRSRSTCPTISQTVEYTRRILYGTVMYTDRARVTESLFMWRQGGRWSLAAGKSRAGFARAWRKKIRSILLARTFLSSFFSDGDGDALLQSREGHDRLRIGEIYIYIYYIWK